MRFQNPANGHIEEFGEATWLWVLVGGPFYLAYKQIWLHAVIPGGHPNCPTYGHPNCSTWPG